MAHQCINSWNEVVSRVPPLASRMDASRTARSWDDKVTAISLMRSCADLESSGIEVGLWKVSCGSGIVLRP
jgi:hypothetical protein